MASDTLGVKPDEVLTIGTYPWRTTHAMWLLERIAALEADQSQRWVMLSKTSPSGKTLYACKCCGRVSPSPDKVCRTIDDPEETWNCSTWKAAGRWTVGDICKHDTPDKPQDCRWCLRERIAALEAKVKRQQESFVTEALEGIKSAHARLDEKDKRIAALEAALRAVLLFHSGGAWSKRERAEWTKIVGQHECTTKVLCDHLRAALGEVDRAD